MSQRERINRAHEIERERSLSPAQSMLETHGCMCNDGRCERCNATAEAFVAMLETLRLALPDPQMARLRDDIEIADAARAALKLADEVMP